MGPGIPGSLAEASAVGVTAPRPARNPGLQAFPKLDVEWLATRDAIRTILQSFPSDILEPSLRLTRFSIGGWALSPLAACPVDRMSFPATAPLVDAGIRPLCTAVVPFRTAVTASTPAGLFWTVSVHEAAHAVICRCLGVPVTGVRIWSPEVGKTGYGLVPAPPGTPSRQRDKVQAGAGARMLCAGAIAEGLLKSPPDSDAAIRQALANAENDPDDPLLEDAVPYRHCIRSYGLSEDDVFAETRALLVRHWPAVLFVARNIETRVEDAVRQSKCARRDPSQPPLVFITEHDIAATLEGSWLP